MFKRIILGVSLFLVLLLGAVFILPTLVPTDTYREKLETELSRVLARDVSVTGDIKISTFPAIEIQTGAVTLANPEGFGATNFIAVEGLDAKVRLWPLLKKQVEISQISLNSPNIWLERKMNGDVNWSVDTPPTTGDVPKTADVGFRRDGRYTNYDPALDLLKIEKGQIRFIDAATEKDIVVKDVNFELRAPALDKPLKLDGKLKFDDLVISLVGQLGSPLNFLNGQRSDFDGSIKTDLGEIDVTGAFLESPVFDVNAEFDVKASDPMALVKRFTLPENVQIPNLNSFAAKGRVASTVKTFNFSDLDIKINGDGLDGSYIGQFTTSDIRSAKGIFAVDLAEMSVITPYLSEPLPSLNALQTLKAEGDIDWNGTAFNLNSVKAQAGGKMIDATFDGRVFYADALDAAGAFDIKTPDLAKLLTIAEIDQPDAAALKALTAKGQVSVKSGVISARDVRALATDGLVNGSFDGNLAYDEALFMDGRATAEILDLGALNAALAREVPFSDIAKHIGFSGALKMKDGTFSLTETEATSTDGDVNGSYRGSIAVGQNPDISGTMTLDVPSLRKLSVNRDVSLPPNTDAGVIFEGLSLSGNVSGTPDVIEFKSGKISLDALSGQGDFKLSLQGDRPILTGEIAFSDLDIQPYMAAWSAQKPQGQIVPWSTAPIDASGLNALDAELRITAPAVKMTRLELGNTDATMTLKNGLLQTRIDETALYGGKANGVFSLRSVEGGTAISLKTEIKNAMAQDFMMAMGGFDKVTGTSSFDMDITGNGQSQAAIMRSLSGTGAFTATNGKLLGINAEALLTGIDGAITSQQLPAGLGLGQTTDFNDLDGGFTISNGRVNLRSFQLQSGALSMEGDGGIDLGGQTLDIGFRPKLDGGSDVANFGVPLRFSGAFGRAKPGLDTDMLAKIAQAKARKSAGDAVKDRLGGPLGNILGGVIGGQTTPSTPASPTEEDTSPESVPEENQVDTEDEPEETSPEEEVLNRLNELFGGKKRSD